MDYQEFLAKLKEELRQWRRAANYNEARANGWVHGFDY